MLKAKTTVTTDRQVMCAYSNSQTLVCGADGDILPPNYNEEYGAFGVSTIDANASCSGNYLSVFSGYDKKWWREEPKEAFTFEIPDDQFPEKNSILLGCQQKPASGLSGGKAAAGAGAGGGHECNVDETIEGGGPESPSSSSTGGSNILRFLASAGAAVSTLSA
ncbi:SAG-related sequence [Besnoitia besnoiti]|uniref:SAG-related sequence n=1 Tax=Besnoitia besnoiti TaxID=94643 RepID=A0A2A9MMP7_BESBE|nr:SAG-related sequence [Besnoitia besnoiti]PFH36832.1 SAG-related sequence [Besnoitia besnoiti]